MSDSTRDSGAASVCGCTAEIHSGIVDNSACTIHSNTGLIVCMVVTILLIAAVITLAAVLS